MQMTYEIKITSNQDVVMNNQDYINMLSTCSLMCGLNGGYKLMRWELLPSTLYRFTTETRDDRTWSQDTNIDTLEVISRVGDNYKISELFYHDQMRSTLIKLTKKFQISLLLMEMSWA